MKDCYESPDFEVVLLDGFVVTVISNAGGIVDLEPCDLDF